MYIYMFIYIYIYVYIYICLYIYPLYIISLNLGKFGERNIFAVGGKLVILRNSQVVKFSADVIGVRLHNH